jgi:hypothetical protein
VAEVMPAEVDRLHLVALNAHSQMRPHDQRLQSKTPECREADHTCGNADLLLIQLSRWVGALTVREGPFIDRTPIYSEDDRFIVRFCVHAEIWLPRRQGDPDRGERPVERALVHQR